MTEAGLPTSEAPAHKPFHQNSIQQMIVLAIWAVSWMAGQNLFSKMGFNPQQQVTAFVALTAAIYGAAFLIRHDWFYQLLVSVQFAVSQMLFMALAVVIGTVVLQDESPDFYERFYGHFAQKLILWTHSANLYRSLWFFALLSLLALSMLAVAWKRRPYPAHRIGFLLVHVSTSVILLGGLWGKYSYVRAFNELRTGEPTNTFYKMKNMRPNPAEPYPIPDFRVQLNQFTIEHNNPEFKLYAFVEPDGKGGFEKNPKAYEVKPGLKARLPLSKLYLSVEQQIPNALEAGEFVNNPNAPENPALRVMLGIGEPQPVIGDLFSRQKNAARRDEPGGRFAVVYQDRWSTDLLNQLRPRAPKAEKIALTFMGKTTLHNAKVGSTTEFPSFSLKVEKYYPDFAVVKDKDGTPHATSRSANPLEPWLELSFRASGGVPRRVMLSARNPGLSDQLNAPNLPKGLKLDYVREGEERQSRFIVFTRGDHSIRLVENGRLTRSEPLQLNKPFIVEKGLSATAVAALDHAEYVPAFVPHPNPKEALKFERPVLKVRLWDPGSGQSEEKWLDALGPDGLPKPETFFDQSVGLIYKAKDTEPKDFRSELVVLDATGKQLASGTVSVNQPLIFHGHWFYQSNYNPEDPSASGIMMVREPSLWLVYAGFLILLVGILWMFYLKPVLKRRDADRKEV
ncbi:MAG: cytochrome c biogenesis protein ResB [Holophagaceae bacterium]|nr:cytochrome c biogenesis protein ResB [Holophagaceae bacterium]